ncbi:MAG: hypothetical protein HQL76_15870 [Magnetococcales bacterium]|nr:hypothetical protein [Magnetococcales bacterium]
MSEASAVSSMPTYSLKSLFRGGVEVHVPSRQDDPDPERFEKTLSDFGAMPQELPSASGLEEGVQGIRPEPSAERISGHALSQAMVSESSSPQDGVPAMRQATLTWQLVSSTTDIEHDGDVVQTAALPLKGYRIYSQAAQKGE